MHPRPEAPPDPAGQPPRRGEPGELPRRAPGRATALDTLIAAAPIGFAVLDHDLRYRRVNQALADMNGVPIAEHLGRTLEEVVPELAPEVRAAFARVVDTGTPLRELEVSGQVPGTPGVTRHWLTSIYPVPSTTDVREIAVVVWEITDRKRVEAERAAYAQRAHRYAERSRQLQVVTAALSAATTSCEVAQIVWEHVRDVTGAAAAGVATLDENSGWLTFVARSGEVDAAGLWDPVPLAADHPLADVARHGRAHYVPHPPHGPPGVGAWAMLPLRVGGQTTGVLALAYTGPFVLSLGQRTFLATLADLCAQVLARVRVAEREHAIADRLQRSLLPGRLPSIPGAELAVRYATAEESVEVGGDFYDAFPGAGGSWMLVIGDVSGRGLDAAGTTGVTRHSLRALGYDAAPGTALRHLNRLLLDATVEEERFVTVACARLRREGDHWAMTLARAGHPAPLLAAARTGEVRPLGEAGTLLGALPEVSTPETEHILFPGDLVLFYTDGALEARGRDGLFGEERLAAALAGCARRSAEEVADDVLRALANYRTAPASDDLALLVLRLTGD